MNLFQCGYKGLIAAKRDAARPSTAWASNNSTQTFALLDGIYAGKKNTEIVLRGLASTCLTSTNAMCAVFKYNVLENGTSECDLDSSARCYADWYLPSKYELNLMYIYRGIISPGGISGFADNYYWSSTEFFINGSFSAWVLDFVNGDQGGANKGGAAAVRPIRAF
jgi:hypothetical protein